jgi:hypothetical protein
LRTEGVGEFCVGAVTNAARSVFDGVAFCVLGVADGAQSRVDSGEDLGLCLGDGLIDGHRNVN